MTHADAIARCDRELAAIAESTGDPWGLLLAEMDWKVEREILEEQWTLPKS